MKNITLILLVGLAVGSFLMFNEFDFSQVGDKYSLVREKTMTEKVKLNEDILDVKEKAYQDCFNEAIPGLHPQITEAEFRNLQKIRCDLLYGGDGE